MTEPFLQSRLLEKVAGLVHAFGTRAAGVGEGAGPPAVLCRAGHLQPQRWAAIRQIHGITIHLAEGKSSGAAPPEADGAASRLNGVPLAVQTADCLPILFAAPSQHWAGALHAGWKGTLAGITIVALELLDRQLRHLPTQVCFALGPAIGPCCYRVPAERLELFAASPLFRDCPELPAMFRRGTLDLWALNRYLLQSRGIAPRQIDTLEICTACHPRLFHSFRRDGSGTGRQWSLIGWADHPSA